MTTWKRVYYPENEVSEGDFKRHPELYMDLECTSCGHHVFPPVEQRCPRCENE